MKHQEKASFIAVILFIGAIGYLYWDTVYEMVMDWYNDENYSHGFLIPVISGYLLWQRKDSLKDISSASSFLGIFIVLSGLCVYLLGKLSGEYFTMRFSMLIVFAGAILYIYGIDFFRSIAFPFVYLVFMIPLPYLIYDAVAFPLKMLVSKFSVDFLGIIGVLVLREGNIIHLADTTLEVADACSGIRSIVSLLALSTALAYLTQTGVIRRVFLSVLAVPIAIVVNSLRVIGTGVLANKYGSQVADSFYHEFAGLLIFGIAIVVLILSAVILAKFNKNSTGV